MPIRVVVVAVDEVGPESEAVFGRVVAEGAVACLVTADSKGACARVGDSSLGRGVGPRALLHPGHEALLPLASPSLPARLTSTSPPDREAWIALAPL